MKILLVIIGFLFLPAIAAADAEYVVHQEGVDMCYLDGEIKSAAQRCGQCVKDAGDAVSRTFRVFCKNDDSDELLKTEKIMRVDLDCDDSESESKDDKWWKQEAEKGVGNFLLPKIFQSNKCDLEEWSFWERRQSLIFGAAVAVLAVAIVVKADDDSKYKLKKKASRSACLSSGNKRIGGAKYCHNCKKGQKGDRIRREYDVFCKDKSVGQVTVVLECKKQYLGKKHGEEEEALLELAKENWREKVASMSSNECVAP